MQASSRAVSILASTVVLVLASASGPAPARAQVNGTWSQITIGSGPSARDGHSAVFDSQRRRMIVFGGDSNGLKNDVWSLDLATDVWTSITPDSAPPPARHYHTAIYDPTGDRMIVYGGLGSSNTILGDVWALSMGTPMTWSQVSPSEFTPCYREGHSAVVSDGAMLVFAGDDGEPRERQDVWKMTLSTNTWTPVSSSDPNDCQTGCPHHWEVAGYCRGEIQRLLRYHAAINDPFNGRMLVFGGWYDIEQLNYNNLWAFAGSTWSLLAPANAATQGPPAMNGHSMVVDAARTRAIVFGGDAGDVGLVLNNDTRELALTAGTAWTHLVPNGTFPGARVHHTAVFDPVGKRMIVFGGENSSGSLGDTWQLSFADTIPPGAISSLDAIQAGSGFVKISWTAPGDDGAGGGAARSYDIRYATSPIDDASFSAATHWGSPPTPASPGTTQNVTINGLTNGTWYYFAIKTVDEDADTSALSNIACAKPGVPASYCEGGPGLLATRDPVESDAPALAIRAIEPNPSQGVLGITFALPQTAPARLELIDAAGRRVLSRDLGSFGAGVHRVELSGHDGLRAGYYIVRVRQGSAVVTRPAIVIR